MLAVANRDLLRRIMLNFGDNALPKDAWKRLQQSLGTDTQVLHSRPQSSGLGLYVAGQFADLMHGRIGATRHKDGATFYVEIDASTQLSLL